MSVIAGPQDITQGMNSLSMVEQVKTGDSPSMAPPLVHQPNVNFQNMPAQPVQPNVGSMVPPHFQMYPNAQFHPGIVQPGLYPNGSQVPVGNGAVMMNVQGVGYSDMYQMEGLLNKSCLSSFQLLHVINTCIIIDCISFEFGKLF